MQNNISHHSSNPQKEILRLIYPQWQGGDIAGWFGDLSQSEASQGYILGAQILNLIVDCILSSSEHSTIAPSKAHSAYSSKHHTAIVPINRDFIVDDSGHRIVQEGIIDKEVLASQTKSALEILSTHKPAKILTLGGECAISVPPFTYLAQMYKDEIAMVWIDAHPDIALPNDDFYKGYHAMAVSAIIGKGGLKESFSLPSH
ncbi:arginase family protein, partial [Helicobacter sp. MIT 14-3879]|uniref:arginase family protein n=1 Tax=Helicobacter sp. MIT 14-3879 TaxID=2040649 RepID=UPI000E39FF76